MTSEGTRKMSNTNEDKLLAQLQALIGRKSAPQQARDPVNQPSIRNWCDAIGEENPIYTDPDAAARSPYGEVVAPPAMLGVWTLAGNIPRLPDPDCPRSCAMKLLAEAGYRSTVGANTAEHYSRALKLGEQLSGTLSLVEVSDLKTTGLGSGYFLTALTEFTNQQGEAVGSWKFRTFHFKPRELTDEERAKQQARKEQLAKIPPHLLVRPRPAVMRETAFFWEGCQARELRIQQCGGCGRLSHPPVVRCPQCGSYDLRYQVASGKAKLYSFVEPVYPPMPFMRYPYIVGLVELAEGTRLLTNIVDCPPELVKIGMDLELVFDDTDPELILPMFRPAQPVRNTVTRRFEDVAVGEELPLWPIDVSTRLVVGGAIATRDFEDIHHEVAAAKRAGLKDLLMNVFTSNGLCSRYLSEWAGPDARVTGVDIRLGTPNVVGDTMTLSAAIADKQEVDGKGVITLSLRGSNSLGDHVTGSMTMELPMGANK